MIAGPTGASGEGAGQAKCLQVEAVDEGGDKADRILLRDVLVKGERELQHLIALRSLQVWHSGSFCGYSYSSSYDVYPENWSI